VIEVTTDDLGGENWREVGGGAGFNATAVAGHQRVAVEHDVGGVPVEENSSKFHCAPRVVCI
jgi:hypothetical protein